VVPVCHVHKVKNEAECKRWGAVETTWERLPDPPDFKLTQPRAFKIEDGKRFYIPGCKLSGKCPGCKKKFERDFGESYLGYPEANKVFDLTLYCPKCEHEWTVRVRLNVSLDLVGKEPTRHAED
jgi:hypothetical protein